MWTNLAKFILSKKKFILTIFILITLFFGYKASQVKLAFNPGKILPTTDTTYLDYQKFKEKFGEDGNAMILGVQSPNLFKKDFFNNWDKLTNQLQKVKGIKKVLSISNLPLLEKDTVNKKFVFNPIISKPLQTQLQLDSIKNLLKNQPFYEGLIFNISKNATIMAITFDDGVMLTAARNPLIKKIQQLAQDFEKKENVKVHLSGLPYIKTVLSALVAKEFVLFLGLTVLISAIILFLFYRFVLLVLFPILLVLIGVIWSVGLMATLGFEITLLTGIIAPLMVIIGVPNSILIINKYKIELQNGNDKLKSLQITIEKISLTTFIANLTTAIGFGVLYFTNSNVLKEFGITAAIGVMLTWLIFLMMLPIILSFIKPIKIDESNLDKSNIFDGFLNKIIDLVQSKRKLIYSSVLLLIVFGAFGVSKLSTNGFVVDDLPKNDPVYRDLKFFENTFNGVLPLEFSIDSKKKNGILKLNNLKKIEKLDELIHQYPAFGKSFSINNVLKYTSQTFYNGNSQFYRLPNEMEKNFILLYAANTGKQGNLMNNFLDEDKQTTRLTFQMKDIGSEKVNQLLEDLKPKVDAIFNPDRYDVKITGPVIMYVKGTNYLIKNLRESLLLAIFLIAVIMFLLFRSFKMIVISLIPNLIPLFITAGLMGYFGLALKPSTVLIFSIALGIASDQTIYFLTRYQQEFLKGDVSKMEIISKTIKETGLSMIYTAIILFFGFGVFAFSTFGGTVALGVLLAITLVFSMLFNLIFLPALLYSFKKE
ncbi:Fis family transcriptional regulator [Pedobacter psychrophilus]|uniref:Fis family transcriptional regulator n=1 Tax=Pedobacter psychrophilus TaxID=1826909 RepID=A0A179DJP7_9SPHI|nr:MMPL family transporter [Pedobacter psychrophilus]OAQ40643.1 Fis family transcriptional regulator [Pedobacter psychrophilus]